MTKWVIKKFAEKLSLFDSSSSENESWCSDNDEHGTCTSYLILAKYTMEEYFEEPMHVKNLDCCDQFDLEQFRMMQEVTEVDNENNMDSNQDMLVLSCLAADLQE